MGSSGSRRAQQYCTRRWRDTSERAVGDLFANARALVIVIAFGIALVAPPLGAQSAALLGRRTERTMSGGDTAQAFAAYIPASYDPSRRTPVLFVLDPRRLYLAGLSGTARAAWTILGHGRRGRQLCRLCGRRDDRLQLRRSAHL